MTCIISETALALASQIEEAGRDDSLKTFQATMDRLGIWISEDDPEFADHVATLFSEQSTLISIDEIAARITPALREEAVTLETLCETSPHRLCR